MKNGYSSFNTSHVVDCSKNCRSRLIPFKFQYISCCSLSKTSAGVRDIPLWFQYISCCSLSSQSPLEMPSNLRFNTSHVVVYRVKRTNRKHNPQSFNTSHVVVYPGTTEQI